jgi:hypothetical protein
MSDLEGGVAEVASVLESLSLPYMLIGGLAVSVWGEPRSTLDSDWVVWTEPDELAAAIENLSQRLRVLVANPVDFVASTRVLPIATSGGVRADIVFGMLGWEREAIGRAKPKDIGGKQIRVAAVEDLILTKIISERQKDLSDCRLLLRRFRSSLDLDYLARRIKNLSDSMGQSDIWELFTEESREQ